MTNGIPSYVKLRKNSRVTPGKLEELGKILGKDLWVRAHSKETPLKQLLEIGIALVELNGLREITTSKYVEQILNGKMNLLR